MKPTIGQIVLYTLSQDDGIFVQDVINAPINAGRQVPAIVVSLTDTTVNLQVFVDNLNDGFNEDTGMIWKQNITQGKSNGQWDFQ